MLIRPIIRWMTFSLMISLMTFISACGKSSGPTAPTPTSPLGPGIDATINIKGNTDVRLTIDRDLQQTAMDQLKGKHGAVVVLNPQTGEVLALYSEPSYSLNQKPVLPSISTRVSAVQPESPPGRNPPGPGPVYRYLVVARN